MASLIGAYTRMEDEDYREQGIETRPAGETISFKDGRLGGGHAEGTEDKYFAGGQYYLKTPEAEPLFHLNTVLNCNMHGNMPHQRHCRCYPHRPAKCSARHKIPKMEAFKRTATSLGALQRFHERSRPKPLNPNLSV
jgi:hypothetical protein